MIGSKGKFINTERKARIIPALIVAIALPFMLFIVSPLEIYKNGINEFEFGLFDFIWILAIVFIVLSIINFAILFVLPKTAYRVVYAILLATTLLLFLQINFLNGGLNSLAGDDVGGTKVKTVTLVFNTIIWVLIEALFIVGFLLLKMRDIKAIICLMVSFALIASQLINFLVIGINGTGEFKTPYEKLLEQDSSFKPTFLTTKNLTTVSKNNNVIIFCVDRFDALENAEPAMQSYPEYFKTLNGFTYYSDTISMYPRTYPSVCYMLTNIKQENNKRKDYLVNAYKDNKTLSLLAEKGYNVNLYTENFYSYFNGFYMPDYISNKEETTFEKVHSSMTFTNKLFLATRLTQISLYRATPFFIKDAFGGVSSSTCNGYVKMDTDALNDKEYSSDMRDLYFNIKDNDFTTTENNNFSFIHFTGCHNVPYDLDFEPTNNLLDTTGDVNVSIKNSLNIINTYLEKMKQIDNGEIYKNSTIIITGDHANINDNNVPLEDKRLTAFFYKPAGVDSGNPIDNVSNKPISHEDLWSTIFASENIVDYDKESIKGYNILDDIPNDRNREYVFHTWNTTQTAHTEYIYAIKGSGKDFKNWSYNKASVKAFNYNYYE